MSQPYLPEEEEVTVVDQFLNSGRSAQDVLDYANDLHAKSLNDSFTPEEQQNFFKKAIDLKSAFSTLDRVSSSSVNDPFDVRDSASPENPLTNVYNQIQDIKNRQVEKKESITMDNIIDRSISEMGRVARTLVGVAPTPDKIPSVVRGAITGVDVVRTIAHGADAQFAANALLVTKTWQRMISEGTWDLPPAVKKDIEDFANAAGQGIIHQPQYEASAEIVQKIAEASEIFRGLEPILGGGVRAFVGVPTPRGATIPAAASRFTPDEPTAPKKDADPVDKAQTTAEDLAREAAKGTDLNRTAWVRAAQSVDPELVKIARDQGILDHLQLGHVTSDAHVASVAAAVNSGVASRTRIAETEGLRKVSENYNKRLLELGGSDDPVQVGKDLMGDLNSIYKDAVGIAKDKYRLIDGNKELLASPTPVNNFTAWYESQVAINKPVRFKSGDESFIGTKDDGHPKLMRDLYNEIKDGGSGYQLIDQKKKLVGSNLDGNWAANPKVAAEASRALFEDQLQMANQFGLGDTLLDANSAFTISSKMKQDFSSIMTSTLDEYNSLTFDTFKPNMRLGKPLKTDDIKAVIDFENLIEIGSKYLDEPAKKVFKQQVLLNSVDTILRKSVRDDVFSFGNYAKWYEGLQKSKPLKKLFNDNLSPDAKKELANMYRISKGIARVRGGYIATGKGTEANIARAIKQYDTNVAEVQRGLLSKVGIGAAAVTGEAVSLAFGGLPLGVSAGGVLGLGYAKSRTGKTVEQPAIKMVEDIILSNELGYLISKIGTPEEAAAIREFTNTSKFKKLQNYSKSQAAKLKTPALAIKDSAALLAEILARTAPITVDDTAERVKE
tara:strand:- start:413 stop:2929 length:2517 start_codon:yes stop_codon:yes gene_type:complete